MRQTIIITLFLMLGTSLLAQSPEKEIEATLSNYINGTSYNRKDQIQKAFYPEAELFLDGRDGNMRVLPIDRYVNGFDEKKRDQFNGRMGRIISIDHFGNIGMAKVEILIPKAKLRFVDMFILKQIEGEWKIISKTANSEESEKTGDRILFVLSNARRRRGIDLPIGNSFKEIVDAYDVYAQAGYNIDFVSPQGGAVPIIYVTVGDSLQSEYLFDKDFMYALGHSLKPGEVNKDMYKAIYYVGGGSSMYGVPENIGIQQIATHIYEQNGGVVASVCHGTAGIVNLKTSDGKYLVDGKRVSGYPESYERQEADYFKDFPFWIQKTIEDHGGTFRHGARETAHVEVDGRLISGQNHLSCRQVSQEVIKAIRNSQGE